MCFLATSQPRFLPEMNPPQSHILQSPHGHSEQAFPVEVDLEKIFIDLRWEIFIAMKPQYLIVSVE
jgi:hypothetical protein